MGVSELWSILDPVRQSVPLYSLSGKTLAVDLSLWVCEAQHVQGMMGKVTKPHLRNLFFRVSSLTLMGVKLVFVMEGDAPKIKAETMSKRTEMRYGNLQSSKPAAVKNTGRGRFKSVLRECAEMLDCLGVPWVTAAGEAEAMCAFLDSQGIVDGCITNDGDAFLYGAQTVYRNFNMNTKDPQVDCYQMSRIQSDLKLNRETLVGLAIFLGCDYIPKGVAGVGKEQTLKLIHNLSGRSLLQKFSEWGSDCTERSEVVVKKVTHCLVCRHPGSAKSHERSGCGFCKSERFCSPQDYDFQCPCEWHRTEHTRQASSMETNIRKKTLACDRFPFTEIISEFLVTKDKPTPPFRRRKPNLLLMQKFALEKMDWPRHYSSEKVLVLMTYTELINRKHSRDTPAHIQPVRIYKARVRNGVSCFEVIWKKPDHYVFAEGCDEQTEVRTIEEESLFSRAYPQIVQDFHRERAEAQENKTKKKKPKAKKEKPSDADDVMSDFFAQMSLKMASDSSRSVEKPNSDVTMNPSHCSDVTVNPSHCSDVTVNPSHCSDVTVNPSHCSDVTMNPSHCSDVTMNPSHCRPQLIPASPTSAAHLSPGQNSPSVSALIGQLQLSSIDWDASSFVDSPSQQTEAPISGLHADMESSQRVDERSLKERIIVKNVIKSNASIDAVLKIQKPCGSESSESKLGDISGPKADSNRSKVPTQCPKTQLNIAGMNAKPSTNLKRLQSHTAKHSQATSAPLSSALMPPQIISHPASTRVPSDNTERKLPSVCVRQDPFSDDSDTENRPRSQKHKVKVTSKSIRPDKTGTTHPPRVKTSPNNDQLSTKTPERHTDIKSTHLIRLHHVKTDSDDSDVSVDSPLPLAERLKMRFAK